MGNCKSGRANFMTLPPEVKMYLLSFLAPHDLCSVSRVCCELAEVSRDESLWRPLGNPDWALSDTVLHGGWKSAYTTWLRTAIVQYSKYKNGQIGIPALPNSQHICSLKFLITGAHGVGKSNFALRYSRQCFDEHYSPTIGVDYHTFTESDRIRVVLWDTLAGTERFHSLTTSYYRKLNGLVIAYDITNRQSFEAVLGFITAGKEHAPADMVGILIGCKADLEDRRVITQEDGRRLADEWGLLFGECSAKDGTGVHEAMRRAVVQYTGQWRVVEGMGMPAHIPSESLLNSYVVVRHKEKAITTTITNSIAGYCCMQ